MMWSCFVSAATRWRKRCETVTSLLRAVQPVDTPLPPDALGCPDWYATSLSAQAAERLKRSIAEEMGIPLVPPLPKQQQQQQLQLQTQRTPEGEAAEVSRPAETATAKPDLERHPYNVRRAALALQRYARQMPDAKRRWV